MRAGPRTTALLHHFESCRLTAYMPTPQDRPTIGWGMTRYPDGRAVKMGDWITQAQANAMFNAIVGGYEAGVLRLLAGTRANAFQFGALVCLAYNIGLDEDGDTKAEGLGDSTLLRKHKAGDFAGAEAEFAKWNKQAGRALAGLTRRRKVEADLYAGRLAAVDRAIGYRGGA